MALTLGRLLEGLIDLRYVDCGPDTPLTQLAVDSRRVGHGSAFLALRGATHDAHRFVRDAFAAGAAVVIVERGRVTEPGGPHVWLPDTAAAYPDIAANAFDNPAQRLRLAGVTGTNGKTTTAHLVGSMLEASGRAHVRLGTTGNWVVDEETPAVLTTPFPIELQALLRHAVDRGATDAVMEVSSHALVQGRVRPLCFTTVGFTSFSQDHLNFHADMHAYLDAKCRLAGEHLRSDGIAIAMVDDQPAADRFLAAARAVGATPWRASQRDASAEVFATDIHFGPHGSRAHVSTPMGSTEIATPLVGNFNLDNMLVAIGLGLGLGLDLHVIARALSSATGAPGRLQRTRVEPPAGQTADQSAGQTADQTTDPSVFVDYAHTPDAVRRAIAVLREITAGRLIVILGCGGDRDRAKRPIMGAVAADLADVFAATSDNPRTEDPEAIVDEMLAGVAAADRTKVRREVDRARAIATAIEQARSDDVILIAGKGHEDYQILGTHKVHFDDREHARAALLRRRAQQGPTRPSEA